MLPKNADVENHLGYKMKIATWNINSIRVRAEQLKDWLLMDDIDIVLLQETKCIDEVFPKEYFEDYGYNVTMFGQKAYNGVAILSKYRIEEIVLGNTIFTNDNQARYIEALVNGYTLISVYVPNGVSPDSEQYLYKMNFLDILDNYVHFDKKSDEKIIIGGDFNIALTDNDVYDPKLWKGKICCTDPERTKLRNFIEGNNLTDTIRRQYGENEKIYSWWDYRRGGFQNNRGLRLDYLFTNHNVNVGKAYIRKEIRNLDHPSDHAPIVIEI